MTSENSQLDLIGGGLAPLSQTVGYLLRTPWSGKLAIKWICQKNEFDNFKYKNIITLLL